MFDKSKKQKSVFVNADGVEMKPRVFDDETGAILAWWSDDVQKVLVNHPVIKKAHQKIKGKTVNG